MRNMSKKTRKKVMQIIKANCHSDKDAYWWTPYKSSRMSAIWHHILTEDCFGWGEFVGVYKDEDEKMSPYFCIEIGSPRQLTNPLLPINVSKQIVRRLEEGGFI